MHRPISHKQVGIRQRNTPKVRVMYSIFTEIEKHKSENPNNKIYNWIIYFSAGDFDAVDFSVALVLFFGNRTGLIFGNTPPLAMVTPWSNFPNSSSFLTASNTCLGLILFFLLSRAAFPANSKTCIAKLKRVNVKWTTMIKFSQRRMWIVDSVIPRRRDTREQRRGRSELRCLNAENNGLS